MPADLALLKHLADSMPGLVSYIGADLKYRYMNRAYFDWFGLDPEANLGKTPRDVATEEGFAAFAPHLLRALDGERLVYEDTIDFRRGGKRAVRGYLVPDRGADGQVHGVFSFTEDITPQREAEDALRAKSQFLAAASHDLRQPLHAMALFITALARRVKDPEGIEIVESLRVAVDSMRAMFAALVDVSKLDAGAMTPAPREFPIADLLAKMRTDFAAQAEAKGIGIRVIECAATVRTDPALLEGMLRNLVHNAVKFTGQGKVLVGCRRRGRTLRIDVIDTAGGIAAEELEGIFDEFRRLQPGRKTGTEGLGLGLAIVRRLSRLLDLPVTVNSVVGRGTRFSIAVPRWPRRRGPRRPRPGSGTRRAGPLCTAREFSPSTTTRWCAAPWRAFSPIGAARWRPRARRPRRSRASTSTASVPISCSSTTTSARRWTGSRSWRRSAGTCRSRCPPFSSPAPPTPTRSCASNPRATPGSRSRWTPPSFAARFHSCSTRPAAAARASRRSARARY